MISATGLEGSIGSVSVDGVAPHGARLAGGLVHVDDHRVQLRPVPAASMRTGRPVEKALQMMSVSTPITDW